MGALKLGLQLIYTQTDVNAAKDSPKDVDLSGGEFWLTALVSLRDGVFLFTHGPLTLLIGTFRMWRNHNTKMVVVKVFISTSENDGALNDARLI